MSMFNTVPVIDIRKETNDAVSIAFEVDKEKYSYLPGQYIVVKAIINNEEIRRSYSLCSAPHENDFRVVVKKVSGGKMSNHLNQNISIGDKLEIMTPSGSFVPKNLKGNIVGFAAGSGITPIFSILKSVINAGGKFTLYYGNINPTTTIYKQEIDSLQNQYPSQLSVIYSFDEGKNLGMQDLNSGRIDSDKIKQFAEHNKELTKSDDFFICGPEPMINSVKDSLSSFGVVKDKIHFELFSSTKKNESSSFENTYTGKSHVTVLMDGEEISFDLDSTGESILDASINYGVDAPFSCKGAVCCTCKAKIIEGKAIMEMNYALSDAEVAQGYILTCQAHPSSDRLIVDFDVT